MKKFMTSFFTSSFRRASVPFLVPSSVVVVVISREVVVFLVVFVGCHVLLDGGCGSGFFHLFEHRFPLFLVFQLFLPGANVSRNVAFFVVDSVSSWVVLASVLSQRLVLLFVFILKDFCLIKVVILYSLMIRKT